MARKVQGRKKTRKQRYNKGGKMEYRKGGKTKAAGAAKKGFDKPKTYKHGGMVSRGMGAALRGGKFTRDG